MKTRALLDLVATGRERGLLRGFILLAVVVGIGPAWVLDQVERLRTRSRIRRVLALRTVTCSGNHPIIIGVGAWTCASCHLPFEGHGFGFCPHCGELAYAVPCPCGRVAVNPLAEEGL